MRLSTASRQDAGLAELQRRQAALGEAQERLVSGKRVAKAADDPVAAARAERALARISISEASQRALEASRTSMRLTESTLGSSVDLLQEARETLVAAGNGAYSDGERATLAAKLTQVREQLLILANRADADGGFLFDGQGSRQAPFVEDAAGVQYQGGPGQVLLPVGESMLPGSVDGAAGWTAVADGSGGRFNLFDELATLARDLATPGRSSATIQAANAAGLARLDRAIEVQGGLRAQAGETLARLDGVETRLGQAKLDAETVRSEAEDLDMVQAISDFQAKQNGYSTALQAYAQVQRLSLFDYLKG